MVSFSHFLMVSLLYHSFIKYTQLIIVSVFIFFNFL